MATVKRLLSDIDNKVAAEKKKPEPFESVITKWASDGFDEKTHPYASGSGKGVFHQAKFLHTFDPEEKFDVPVKASFDFGSASKKKAIADLNKRLSGHGIMASVSYPDDDSGNDQIIFSKIPQENKKINPKKVYQGAAPRSHLYFGGIDEETLRKSNDFKIKEYLKDLDEGRKNPRKEFTGEVGEIQKKINERLKQIKSVPNDIGKLKAANPKNKGTKAIVKFDNQTNSVNVNIPAGALGNNPDLRNIASRYWLGGGQNEDGSYSFYGDNDEIEQLLRDYNIDYAKDNGKSEGNKTPLHIRSLQEQVSKNPDYKSIVDSIDFDKSDEGVSDAYFYAFKDAYEKTGYKPTQRDIENELNNRYYDLMDRVREGRGMSENEWDRYGYDDFAEKYGNEQEFIKKGMDAYNRATQQRQNLAPNKPAKINPRQVYENASNAKPVEKAPENDYGGLGEEHNRLFEEYMSIDGAYRNADAELDDKVRKGQINTDEWWDKKSKLYDYYTGLKKNKKAEMDSVYAKIKAIDDERNRKAEEAKKQKESEALTARRNQVRADLEKRTGRKYSDDEWATIVELASQLR